MNPTISHPIRYWRWQRARRRAGGDWPEPTMKVSDAPLLVIDLEMTGLDPRADDIVSIGWVPIDAGSIDLSGAREIRLPRHRQDSVGQSATIHGLRDCDLEDAATAPHALQALLSALRGRVAVFHHAPLDLAFLQRALAEHDQPNWASPVIDTLAWHKRRLKLSGRDEDAQGATTLEAACRHHGLAGREAHSALADALSCAELLLALSRHSRAALLNAAVPPFRAGTFGASSPSPHGADDRR